MSLTQSHSTRLQVAPLLEDVPDQAPGQLLSLAASGCGLRQLQGLGDYSGLCILSLQDNKLHSLRGEVRAGCVGR